jgi:uncharacterized membrane protein YeaQ/YmgE (transglycosylase-associated protein family)
MTLISFLVVGLTAGWLASLYIEGHGLGAIGDMGVGIIGAVVGGMAFSFFGIDTYGFWGSVGMSVLGAMLFLFVVGIFTGSTRQISKF